MDKQQLVSIINDLFEREGLESRLNSNDFEGAVIKKVPKADICRWKRTDLSLLSDEDQVGILNSEIIDREDSTLRNTNGQTHLTYNKNLERLFSAIPFDGVFSEFSLCYPCAMLEENLHLLVNHSPDTYYSQSRTEYLISKYNQPTKRHEFDLALKIEAQDRVMVANKTSILSSDIPTDEKVFLLENRYLLFKDDYVIILKQKKQMKYMMIFLPTPALSEDEIQTIGPEKISYAMDEMDQQLYPTNALELTNGKNILIFGAPGTGKSFHIKENFETTSEYFRVVFHEEYSYQDFVGCIKPIITESGPTYDFVPGPFTKILQLALENRMSPYTLIIEELNRANAASVFGDIFQLLDRDENSWSEYSIENEEVLKYLNKYSSKEYTEIKIPGNLSIVATMNSADQGVFPMDTAFKRRWNYEYMPIEFSDWHETISIPYIVELHESTEIVRKIYVKNYIEIINNYLTTNETLEINEDRLIGPHYLKRYEWEHWTTEETYKKLLAYLWDDVARLDRPIVFKEHLKQFSDVCNAVKNNEQIFNDNLHTLLQVHLIPLESNTEDQD